MYTLKCGHKSGPEDNLQKSVISFHHLGPKNPTQATRLCSRQLYPLSHLFSPHATLVILLLSILPTSLGAQTWSIHFCFKYQCPAHINIIHKQATSLSLEQACIKIPLSSYPKNKHPQFCGNKGSLRQTLPHTILWKSLEVGHTH